MDITISSTFILDEDNVEDAIFSLKNQIRCMDLEEFLSLLDFKLED